MEGDAGTSRLNPTDADDAPDESVAVSEATKDTKEDAEENANEDFITEDSPEDEVSQGASEEPAEAQEPAEAREGTDPAGDGADRRSPRLGRGWVLSICAVLVVLTAGMAAGGYLALRAHHDSEAIARDESAAVQSAKECVSATQAPDPAAMAASQQKIIECSTGDFAVQATVYSGVLVDAYQAANVKVQVSDIRAAAERHNDDRSVQVLVAVRVKVTNSEAADQEQGYRLRVRMAPADGTYKIAKLDQVTS
jgi:Mce-associated membrane protein